MSKGNKKTPKHEWDAVIRQTEKSLARNETLLTRFVKSANPKFVDDATVNKFVEMAQGSIVETIPFPDGSNQFKVEIKRKFLTALEGAGDALRIGTKPFTAPSHSPHPRNPHRSHDPK